MNKRVAGFFLATTLAWPLWSLPQQDELKLEQLLRDARERNPRIHALQREADAADHRIAPARALPDPMLALGLKNMGLSSFTLGMDPQSGLGLSLSQSFPFFGKLGLKGDIAADQAARKRQSLVQAVLEVEDEIRMAYNDYASSHLMLQILERQRQAYQDAVASALKKYSAGGGSQSDVL
jgi:cobalt-zinc-cadmium efflux system outer membrane protein